jgi:hypothetical protein
MPRAPLALLLSLGAGLVAGLLYASVGSGGRLSLALGLFLPLPLFMAGLSLGVPGAAIAGLMGALVAAPMVGVLGAGVFLAAFCVPVTVLCRQALLSREVASAAGTMVEWYPPGALVTWATGLCAALATAVFLYHAGEEGGLRGALARQADRMVDLIVQQRSALMAGQDEGKLRALARIAADLQPTLRSMMWMVVMLMNFSLAQWGVTRMGRNLRPAPALADVRLPPALAAALALALALAFLSDTLGYYAASLSAILSIPYVLAGLAVMHVLTRGRPTRVPVLVLTYLCLFIFTFPLVLLGLADQAFDLRGRFGRRTV